MNITVTELARHFSEYLNRVSYRGETFLLVRGKNVLAELRPAPKGRRLGDLPALLASLPRLEPGDAARFAKEISAAKKKLNRRTRDPWES